MVLTMFVHSFVVKNDANLYMNLLLYIPCSMELACYKIKQCSSALNPSPLQSSHMEGNSAVDSMHEKTCSARSVQSSQKEDRFYTSSSER